MEAYEVEREVARELSPDEKLLWSGQPRQGLMLKASDAFLIPFSLMWCGFAIYWETGVVTSGAPLFSALWGIPFVAAGLYMVFGRFFHDAGQRKRMAYAVTDSRAIIITNFFRRTVKSINLRALTEVSVHERPDGSGTITFGAPGPAWSRTNAPVAPSFEGVANVRMVFELVRKGQSRESR